jgi:hypothetical protein
VRNQKAPGFVWHGWHGGAGRQVRAGRTDGGRSWLEAGRKQGTADPYLEYTMIEEELHMEAEVQSISNWVLPVWGYMVWEDPGTARKFVEPLVHVLRVGFSVPLRPMSSRGPGSPTSFIRDGSRTQSVIAVNQCSLSKYKTLHIWNVLLWLIPKQN